MWMRSPDRSRRQQAGADDLCQKVAIANEPNCTVHVRRARTRGEERRFCNLEAVTQARRQFVSCWRRQDPARMPFEQGPLDHRFQRRDVLGNGGLGEPELARRRADRALPIDLDEGAQLLESHKSIHKDFYA
jgi:hypothetical protein